MKYISTEFVRRFQPRHGRHKIIVEISKILQKPYRHPKTNELIGTDFEPYYTYMITIHRRQFNFKTSGTHIHEDKIHSIVDELEKATLRGNLVLISSKAWFDEDAKEVAKIIKEFLAEEDKMTFVQENKTTVDSDSK